MIEYSIAEIKKMNVDELSEVAKAIREQIIKTVSINGGHLASNLGIVELTIALHYVFNSPRDLFFFDVSHQVYTHKLLTGRSSDFYTLRKYRGITGFSNKEESVHDIYEAGHSSTSISAALGYLEAKETNPDLFDDAIAVIGDAAIVNGLSLEALNYLGSKPNQKMIVILNDNEMGISKNVGGLAKTFTNIRAKGRFKILRKIMPKFLKRMMKSYAYSYTLFNSMGLKYLGVIDGHDFKALIKALNYAKNSPTSVIIHVKTIKGKGYNFSEEDKTGYWHHTNAFDIESGVQKVNPQDTYNFGSCLSDYLLSLYQNNHHELRVITPGMAYGSGLESFQVNAPKAFIDVGIAEENAIVMATAMAQAGLKPFVFVYSTFLQRAYDEIIHDMARNNQGVVIALDRSGIVDGDGGTHQGIYDVAYLSSIPGVIITAPRNLQEAKLLVDYGMAINKPLVIRYPKNAISNIKNEIKDVTKYDIIKDGSSYVVAYGPVLDELEAAINDNNLKVGLINARFIRPFDQDLIKRLLMDCHKLYFYEEVVANNCLASQIISYANQLKNEKVIDSFEIVSFSLPDTYLETGNRDELKEQYGLSIQAFVEYLKGE